MQVRDEYLRAVPSETMRSFLSEKMASGEFCPSPEDMVSAVFCSRWDIFEKADFYRLLLGEELSEDTRGQLERLISFTEFIGECVENKSLRYAFVCEDFLSEPEREYVFNSFRRAAKYLRKTDGCYMYLKDKREKRNVAELITDRHLRITDANEYHPHGWRREKGDITAHYVKYPVPFKVGDVVYSAADPQHELFCVVNTEQPDNCMLADCRDSCVTVIPYKFRSYATTDEVRAHYERLSKNPGICFCNDISELDVISRTHEHFHLLYTESAGNVESEISPPQNH